MLVKMTAGQIREIKPYRYFFLGTEDMADLEDFEFVFSKQNAYKINIYTGETEWYNYEKLFIDYPKLVEGLEDGMEVLVEPGVYRTWKDTKDKGVDSVKA